MTLQDVIDSATKDVADLVAARAPLTADDTALAAALAHAGVTAFSALSADSRSVITFTPTPDAKPPFATVTTPMACAVAVPAGVKLPPESTGAHPKEHKEKHGHETAAKEEASHGHGHKHGH